VTTDGSRSAEMFVTIVFSSSCRHCRRLYTCCKHTTVDSPDRLYL